ncbi:MAG: T9SS type A sorting domain-containing protein, partial [Saprospiraceae bacterium]
ILGYDPRTLNTVGRDYYYGATNLAYDSLGLLRSASSFGGKGDSPDDNDTREIFRVDFKTAFIEMDLALASSTYDVATSGEATLFPNPASSELYIDLTLPQVSKNVKVDLMSIDGRIVTSASFQQVQESRLRLDLTDIVSGTYNALIQTDEGVITRKVVIQK